MTKVFPSPDALAEAVGTHIGTGDWTTVDQQRIDLFAEATGDHQWIHVDPERAATGPFGTTIAHGFLTLSLLPVLVKQVYRTEGVGMAVNYGLNKVRFMHPVRVGSKVRASVDLVSVEEVPAGRQVVSRVTVEIDGVDKPACVAETVTRLYG
ncbi:MULTISPECIES: MaoC family dehydratase [Streptomyces]|uniref:MaoC family dehydratase n=1 Tax=Streptomyces cinereoruber TaxID=67260 RepID=A0ABX6BL99_9ACTN|nr:MULTISPECIES: MaoC family dehydratase [Streptomyces]AVH94183.1 MaoC family dehydratase [Streptomyces sp. WAC00288]KYG51394.1 dehydratase [Streptomyces sp. WAC04657]MBB4162315.1 acyl dehydratase [Streptomyces cinereoruber]MBY8820105.1 MaoC family dehydratase [Streptomyces cinereoruber]NIH63418.1 acyl dehydratase [Streptomyces cinereoruber]